MARVIELLSLGMSIAFAVLVYIEYRVSRK